MTIVVNLPKLNQTGANEWADVEDNDVALKAGVEKAGEEIDAISGLTWYTPKVIPTQETRENTAFGTLPTADEIKSVVLAENGLIVIGYRALVKSSVEGAGRVALFLGGAQVKAPTASGGPAVQEASLLGAGFNSLVSHPGGLSRAGTEVGSDVTTGQLLMSLVGGGNGGFAIVYAAPATYDISVKYKATSGSITATERKLWCCTLG